MIQEPISSVLRQEDEPDPDAVEEATGNQPALRYAAAVVCPGTRSYVGLPSTEGEYYTGLHSYYYNNISWSITNKHYK